MQDRPQIFHRVRLQDEIANAQLARSFRILRADVAGGENDGEIRPDLQDARGEIAPAHARHGEIGDDDIETIGLGEKRLQCRLGLHEPRDIVAQSTKNLCGEVDEGFLVIHIEQALTVSRTYRPGRSSDDVRARFASTSITAWRNSSTPWPPIA